jgi:hypothetical protein
MGQITLLKAAVKRSGLINHQISIASLGPNINRDVITQHRLLLLSNSIVYF